MAAVLRVGRTVLTTGAVVRIVDFGAGSTPRYALEVPAGTDGLAHENWAVPISFTPADVIAMLTAVGFLAP